MRNHCLTLFTLAVALAAQPSMARGGGSHGTWGTEGNWGNSGSTGWGNDPAGLNNAPYTGSSPGYLPVNYNTANGGMSGDPLRAYYQRQEEAKLAAAQAEAWQHGLQNSSQQRPGASSYPDTQRFMFGANAGPVTVIAAPIQASWAQQVDAANAVRDNFHGSGLFAAGWWEHYKNAWFNPAWQSDWVWENADWSILAKYWNLPPGKVAASYSFGEGINYANGLVFFGDQPSMKLADFYLQAQMLEAKGDIKPAATTTPPTAADWQSLGVFSLTHAGQKFSTTLLQLAVNKEGLLRGNCYNIVSGQLDTVSGAVDKNSSRVAFIIGGNHAIILDSGMGNLLSAQSPIWVHIDKNQVEQMSMVRLRQARL